MTILTDELRLGIADEAKSTVDDAAIKMTLGADEIDRLGAVRKRLQIDHYILKTALTSILTMSDVKEIYATAQQALDSQIDGATSAQWEVTYVGP